MNPILISISPNTECDDVLMALKILFMPWKWRDDKYTKQLESLFVKVTGLTGYAFAVNSGRSSLYLILKALGIGNGDEVINQAFTCVAVPNSAIWNGAKPVYVDIDDTYNIDPEDLEKKITDKTKAVIVQHTFGIPAKFEEIKEIADRHGILVIEDCAHALGSIYKGKRVGSLGDISFFSFGRDKCISSVFGGMILTKDKKLAKKFGQMQNELPQPNLFWIKQQILHPIIMALVKPFYNFGLGGFTLGKLMLVLAQRLRLLSFPVYASEKYCGQPNIFPAKMPGALSLLAINQLKKLAKFVAHRKKISKIYNEKVSKKKFDLPPDNNGISFLRYPIRSNKAIEIKNKFKSKGILLGDWYNKAVVPVSDLSCTQYIKGKCPSAENYSNQIINLPTYIGLTEKDVMQIINMLNE
jgi:perosamine synthetase